MQSGENLQQVWERSQAAYSILSSAAQNQLKTGLVVAHDATNKALLCQILGLMLIISGTSARATVSVMIIPKVQMVYPCYSKQ